MDKRDCECPTDTVSPQGPMRKNAGNLSCSATSFPDCFRPGGQLPGPGHLSSPEPGRIALRGSVVEIVERLKRVLFPGYFGEHEVDNSCLSYPDRHGNQYPL